MRGIELPERTEDFTADPVELFFDLGYVLAFSQLVSHLVHHPDWGGVGEAVLLFWLLWLPWSQFTWSANAVSGNGRTVRVLFLLGAATSVPMAASVGTAFGPGGPVFAICLGIIYLLAFLTMVLGLERGSATHGAILRFGLLCSAAIAVLIVGSFLDDGARVAVWLLALATIFASMAQAGRHEWIIRFGHFAERHALIIIIALGEVIVAIGAPVVSSLEAGQGLPGVTVLALGAAGVFAGLLWWGYFDRPGPAIEHGAEAVTGDRERGRFARDVYTLFHAPVVIGIILSAAALEEIALHPTDEVTIAFRGMLAGGLALIALGISAGVWRTFGVVARERLVAVLVIAVIVLAAASMPGVVLLVAVDAVLLATLAIEHVRIER